MSFDGLLLTFSLHTKKKPRHDNDGGGGGGEGSVNDKTQKRETKSRDEGRRRAQKMDGETQANAMHQEEYGTDIVE